MRRQPVFLPFRINNRDTVLAAGSDHAPVKLPLTVNLTRMVNIGHSRKHMRTQKLRCKLIIKFVGHGRGP